MKERDVEALAKFDPDNIPFAGDIGASKSSPDLPVDGLRAIRPVVGAHKTDQFCAAIVRGSSLLDDGIFDGDCAIIKITFERYEVTPGRLVAILTPYGLLLKHCYLTLNGEVRLVSANPAFQDLTFEPEQITIQGIVVRIERDL
jgi:SOS-response transcriptional repressor LexA